MKKFLTVLGLFAVILCGCGRKNSSAIPNFVTKIDVSCHQNGKEFFISYTDNEKVEAMLLYLRLLKRGRTLTQTPPTEDPSIYQIRVHLYNGESRLYAQVDHRYLWQEKNGWSTIPAQQASDLYAILRHYPSDI